MNSIPGQPTSFSWQHKGWQLGETFPLKVLACMLRDNTFLKETYDCLDPVYFSREDYSVLAAIVKDYFAINGRPPMKDDLLILIHDRCRKIDPDGSLGRVSSLSSWSNRVYDIDIVDVQLIKDNVREFGRLQAVAKAIQRSLAYLEDTNPNRKDDDTIAKIQKTINDSFQIGVDKKTGTFFNEVALDTPRILIEDSMYGQDSKVPTGIKLLDEILGGGPGAGTMNVIMAPPNRGKSTILTYFGISAALHFSRQALTTGVMKSVIHITCEMTEPDIQAKYAAGFSGIPIDGLTKNQSFRNIMEQRLKQISPVHIKFYPPGSPTVEEVQWYVSNLVTAHGVKPGLIVVDYADLFRGMEDDRFVGMGVIYKQLIAMGHKFGCPVWNGCQINRDEAKKMRHGVTGAAESWKKVEISDNIIILNQTEEEHKQGLMIIGLGKIRRGSRQHGSINCNVDFGRVVVSQSDAAIQYHDGKTSVSPTNPSSTPSVPSVPSIPSISLATPKPIPVTAAKDMSGCNVLAPVPVDQETKSETQQS